MRVMPTKPEERIMKNLPTPSAKLQGAAALGAAPVPRLLFSYSLPAIAGMIAVSLYNIVDSIFIGRWVGPDALTALGVAFPLMNVAFAFGMLLGVGGAAVCSIRMGAKDMDGARRVLGNVAVLNVIVGALFCLAGSLALEPALLLFGASDRTLEPARDFMQVFLLSLPIGYSMFNLTHIMRASGYPYKAMSALVLTVVCNALFAPVFIKALGWGIFGAALATLCAQAVGLLWVLRHFCAASSSLRFSRGFWGLRLQAVRAVLAIGLAPCLMNLCACAVVGVINLALREHGGDAAIGAFGVINRVLFLFVMVVMGLAQGMQPVLGYNFGARRPSRVREALRLGIAAGTLVTSAGCLAAELFPGLIVSLFSESGPLAEHAVRGLRLCALAMPVVGAQVIISNFFQSVGRAGLSAFLALSRQCVYLIPCVLVAPRFLGLDGVWLAIPISDALAFVTCLLVFYWSRRELWGVRLIRWEHR